MKTKAVTHTLDICSGIQDFMSAVRHRIRKRRAKEGYTMSYKIWGHDIHADHHTLATFLIRYYRMSFFYQSITNNNINAWKPKLISIVFEMMSVRAFLLLCLATLAVAKQAHVYVIIGQSNGVGLNSDGHTDEDTTDPNILQTSCCANGTAHNDDCRLIQGQDPLHHQCDDGFLNSQNVGFGMTFARHARAQVDNETLIVLVPAAIGGTGFLDNVWTAYTGTGFVQALQRINSTFKLLKEQYPDYTPSLQAFLWHQGENEADQNISTTEYLNHDIIPMINAWRNSTLIPQSGSTKPFIVGQLLPHWVEDPDQTKRLGVFVALQVLNQYVPYVAFAPSQGLVGDSSEGATPIHFSGASQRAFGTRYFAAYYSALVNHPIN